MKSKKILVVNEHGPKHDAPFRYLGMETVYCTRLLNVSDTPVGLVVFTGGADVSPELYSEARHRTTHCSPKRDMLEINVFNQALEKRIPMVGICRGAQLLCVMAGGKLIQDVTGHSMCTHSVVARYPDGTQKDISVKGDHHQMQYPWDIPESEYEVLAEGAYPRSKHYIFGPDKKVLPADATEQTKREPDVVWYKRIRALAIQFHPEWMSSDCEAVEYVRKLTDHYLVPLINDQKKQGAASA